MPRFTDYDSDSERLPEGMTRMGYDADTQVYTFRDARGQWYEGPAGVRHPSEFTRVPSPSWPAPPAELRVAAEEATGWRHEHMPLLNFFLIVGVFLLGVFWFMGYSLRQPEDVDVCGGREGWVVRAGDTCWGIADEKKTSVEELLGLNQGLDCDHLQVGRIVCLPETEATEAT